MCVIGCNGGVTSGPPSPPGPGPSDAGPDGHTPAPTGRWESGPDMPGPGRFYTGVAALGERVFVVGGFGAAQATVVTAYDTKAGTWETLAPLPIGIQLPNVAAVGGTLYVLGGLEQKSSLAYDAAKNQWDPRSPAPVMRGRGQAAVGVWGTKILLAGGVVPGKSANDLNTGMRQHEVLAYDTTSDTWEALPDLALTRGYAMGAVIGDRFWVMGGSTDFARTDDVAVLDLKTRQWMDQPPLPITLSSAGVAVVGNRIYLVGGVATGTGTIGPATFALDPDFGIYDQVALMITPRWGMGAVAVGGRIYVPSGIAADPVAMFKAVNTMEVFIP
ncbi:MAG TPA: hypothetical protein VN914_02895 [Polyangia bacterium]|nr:hypothetical protein [Polyangia bacterium]